MKNDFKRLQIGSPNMKMKRFIRRGISS